MASDNNGPYAPAPRPSRTAPAGTHPCRPGHVAVAVPHGAAARPPGTGGPSGGRVRARRGREGTHSAPRLGLPQIPNAKPHAGLAPDACSGGASGLAGPVTVVAGALRATGGIASGVPSSSLGRARAAAAARTGFDRLSSTSTSSPRRSGYAAAPANSGFCAARIASHSPPLTGQAARIIYRHQLTAVASPCFHQLLLLYWSCPSETVVTPHILTVFTSDSDSNVFSNHI